MILAAPETGATMTGQDARRWIPIDGWLRHHQGDPLTHRQRRLASLSRDYEAKTAQARRGRRAS